MAFSLLSGKQLFLILATSAALLLVAYLLFFRSRGKLLQQIAFILVLAGGIGNLIDRVLNGEVVDYINPLFIDFAVFNFADILVCVGVALWVLVILLEKWKISPRRSSKPWNSVNLSWRRRPQASASTASSAGGHGLPQCAARPRG
mgnify:CR=1 FL=1